MLTLYVSNSKFNQYERVENVHFRQNPRLCAHQVHGRTERERETRGICGGQEKKKEKIS